MLCFCILTQLESHRCSPNKDGHFKDIVLNFEKCSNVLKRGNVGVLRHELQIILKPIGSWNMNPTDDDHP